MRSEHWRYILYEDGGEELYAHRTDPNEWTNLALDPTYKSVSLGLRAWLPTEEVPVWPGRQ